MNTATTPGAGTGRGFNLALATWVSAINFWAWNMIGPLSTTYAGDLSLSSTQASLLVATPILVGALGRIVVGSLTDRFGGRIMFIAISLASILPVLAVGIAGAAGSYPLLLVFGFFLGLAGTIFAVGIPFANAWYEPSRRGFATGVFGAGMVGTALSAAVAQRLARRLCPRCKQPVHPDLDLLRRVGFPLNGGPAPQLFKAVGCTSCSNTGYRGRLALHEVMVVTEEVEHLVVRNATGNEVRRLAVEQGTEA